MQVIKAALRDLRFAWKNLALADLAYKLVAFLVLTPVTLLAIKWLIERRYGPAVADVDILRLFTTTRTGLIVLVGGGAVLAAITALETSCLLAIGVAASAGRHLAPRHALLFAGARARKVILLTAHMVVRVLAAAVPFGLVAGAVYATLLDAHDINYYLADRPPSFWGALAVVVVLVATIVWLVLRTAARWALALPLVLFEDVAPGRALRASAARSAGRRGTILAALLAWAAIGALLVVLASWLPEAAGRALAPGFAGSFGGLVTFIGALAIVWTGLGLLAAVVNVSLFALVVVRLYLATGPAPASRVPESATIEESVGVRFRRPLLVGIAVVALLTVLTTTALAIVASERDQAVVVIAHRGASAAAPENTLPAFRIAGDMQTDFVELDVQESSDGEVVVVHDSDLMRVGNSPLKVWAATLAELEAVPIPGRPGQQGTPARVPRLSEVLAACKGRSRMLIELKSYGHDQRLEERVVALVEAAGMADQAIYMSLDHDMVRKMKELRPSWRCGILVAKALGDLTALHADFLAVERKIASRRFVRRAHLAGQEVYVWTVNDAATMLAAMSVGADGLITDHPDAARELVLKRAAMSDAQRVLVALLVRLGVTPVSTDGELRP